MKSKCIILLVVVLSLAFVSHGLAEESKGSGGSDIETEEERDSENPLTKFLTEDGSILDGKKLNSEEYKKTNKSIRDKNKKGRILGNKRTRQKKRILSESRTRNEKRFKTRSKTISEKNRMHSGERYGSKSAEESRPSSIEEYTPSQKKRRILGK